MNTADEQLIRRYLLRQLDDHEQQQIEERLMTDDDFFAHVLLIEDEMVEGYVWDELPSTERARFEQTLLLTPEGQQQVTFNATLKQYIAKQPKAIPAIKPSESKSWWATFAAFWQSQKPLAALSMATVALLLAVTIWLAWRVGRLHAQVASLQTAAEAQKLQLEKQLDEAQNAAAQLRKEAQTAQDENTRLQQQLAETHGEVKKNDAPAVSLLALVLMPGSVRSSDDKVPEAKLSPDKPLLQLTLRVPEEEFRKFAATITLPNGTIIKPASLKTIKKASETQVLLQLPTTRLAVGEYVVNLTGIAADSTSEPLHKYFFRVSQAPR